MKRVIPGLLLLPLLSSCVVQEEYYAPGYYPPPPPPPYVEVHRYEAPRHEHHRHHGYRPVPQARVYQGHANPHGNVHANVPGNASVTNRAGRQAVVVSPRQPQVQQAPVIQHPAPQQSPQAQTHVNAHGNTGTAHGSQPVVQHNNVEQHN